MEIGIRELRDGLSRHLAHVREGHTLTVTDHGRPVARLIPVDHPTTLEALIASGQVTRAPDVKRPAPAPLTVDATVSDLIADQRP